MTNTFEIDINGDVFVSRPSKYGEHYKEPLGHVASLRLHAANGTVAAATVWWKQWKPKKKDT